MPAYQYTPALVPSFISALSQQRLDTYMQHARRTNAHATLEDALDLYIWNLQVSAAFQGPLHVLEVCLRNAMHVNLTIGFTNDWVDNGSFIHACIQAQYPPPQAGQKHNPPGPDLLRDIYKVRNRVARDLSNKNARAIRKGQPPGKMSPTVNDVVAGLDFGFWTTMLDSRFEQTLWRPVLHHAFPNYAKVTGTALDRRSVQKRFNALRDLRNRVMHHEPLFGRVLIQDFADIAEAISWMYDDIAQWVGHHSRLNLIQTTQANRPETF
ncbi:MAG TPA: Abi family protein [Dongiaceae bacterium]|nr:Abi family protein [Dongiaceae bacterium]